MDESKRRVQASEGEALAAEFGIPFFETSAMNNINDFLQVVFSFVNAPLFATFLLGMFWKRATGHGAFAGLLAGTLAAAAVHGLTIAEGKGGWITVVHEFGSGLSHAFNMAWIAFTVNLIVTILVSLVTKPKKDEEMKGLVYSLTPKVWASEGPWYSRPLTLAVAVCLACLALNFIFA